MKAQTLFLLLLLLLTPLCRADVIINFEQFTDSEILTNQIPGLTFTNTIVLTAGISLNELEFPPNSGVNVISDNGGPITIDFDTPVVSVGGYFTYLEPLTLTGLDSMGDTVATDTSLFSDNDALFGDAGSSPNELISISYAGGISSITAEADPLGGSFTLDDLTYEPLTSTSVPEPSWFWLLSVLILSLAGYRRHAHR